MGEFALRHKAMTAPRKHIVLRHQQRGFVCFCSLPKLECNTKIRKMPRIFDHIPRTFGAIPHPFCPISGYLGKMPHTLTAYFIMNKAKSAGHFPENQTFFTRESYKLLPAARSATATRSATAGITTHAAAARIRGQADGGTATDRAVCDAKAAEIRGAATDAHAGFQGGLRSARNHEAGAAARRCLEGEGAAVDGQRIPGAGAPRGLIPVLRKLDMSEMGELFRPWMGY